jgi:hypothetical protein
MIQVSLSWVYIALLFYVEGDLFEWLLGSRFASGRERPHLPAFLKIPLGISFLILQLSILHFFLPISQSVHLGIVAMLIVYLLIGFKELRGHIKISWTSIDHALKNNLPFWLIFFAIGLLFSYVATDYPFYNRDDGRYHFQAMLWAKEYPIIPGLANLHDRLGSNSAWYLVNAFFDHFWLNRKVFHVLNSFLIFYLFIISLHLIFRTKKNQAESNILLHTAGIFIFLFLSLKFEFIRTWLFLSVTPDTAVHFFVMCFLLFLLFFYEQRWFETCPEYAAVILMVIIFSAFSVRISGMFMALSVLPLMVLLAKYKALSIRNVLSFSLLGALFIAIVLVRNLLLSGYLFFPAQYFDIFSFDWKLPRQIAHYTGDWISNHSIYEFTGNDTEFIGLMDGRRISNIARMFVAELAQKGIMFFNIVAVAGLVGLCSFLILRKRKFEWLLASFSIIFVLQLGLCYIAGPTFRFGVGYRATALILPLVLLVKSPLQRLSNFNLYRWALVPSVLLLVLLCLYRPATPISIKNVRLEYPIKIMLQFVQNITSFPDLVRSKQRTLVVDEKLTVNVSDFDDSYLQLARFPTHVFHYPSCPRVEVFEQIKGHRSCEEYNAFVATMNWMDPLPSVGAIYRGLTLRGERLRDGFKIVTPENRSN